MDKLLLKKTQFRRIFLIGCISENRMQSRRYQLKQLMKGVADVEFIYQGLVSKIKPYEVERVVDSHPLIDGTVKSMYAGGKYRNYMNLRQQSTLNAKESFQSAIQLYQHQYGYNPEWVLVVQV